MKTKNGRDLWFDKAQYDAMTLTQKGYIPSYVAELWANNHSGISPLGWKRLYYLVISLWYFAAFSIICGGLVLADYFFPSKEIGFGGEMGVLLWVAIVLGLFGYLQGDLVFFYDFEKKWTDFNSYFKELAFIFPHELPENPKDLIEKVNETLVGRAYENLKANSKFCIDIPQPIRFFYDAAKAFGILKYPSDAGYTPYFAEAQERLDQEKSRGNAAFGRRHSF